MITRRDFMKLSSLSILTPAIPDWLMRTGTDSGEVAYDSPLLEQLVHGHDMSQREIAKEYMRTNPGKSVPNNVEDIFPTFLGRLRAYGGGCNPELQMFLTGPNSVHGVAYSRGDVEEGILSVPLSFDLAVHDVMPAVHLGSDQLEISGRMAPWDTYRVKSPGDPGFITMAFVTERGEKGLTANLEVLSNLDTPGALHNYSVPESADVGIMFDKTAATSTSTNFPAHYGLLEGTVRAMGEDPIMTIEPERVYKEVRGLMVPQTHHSSYIVKVYNQTPGDASKQAHLALTARLKFHHDAKGPNAGMALLEIIEDETFPEADMGFAGIEIGGVDPATKQFRTIYGVNNGGPGKSSQYNEIWIPHMQLVGNAREIKDIGKLRPRIGFNALYQNAF